jgi:hypothetical protein
MSLFTHIWGPAFAPTPEQAVTSGVQMMDMQAEVLLCSWWMCALFKQRPSGMDQEHRLHVHQPIAAATRG